MAYPPLEPFAHGMLPVTDGNSLYYETSGNPQGVPVLYLHGGPGSGLGPGGYRRRADPSRHLIVGFDQRGCGRSLPSAIDALDHLHTNTTVALIADIEALREHLGLERWLVTGVSWGSTLALAYAQAHPDRVTGIVLMAVTTTGSDEIDWITEGVGRVFPEAWERFEADSGRLPGERVVEAYARRLRSGDAADRELAAEQWDAWESVHVSLDPAWEPGPLHPDPVRRRIFATLVTHYWANHAFLGADEAVLARTDRLHGIPGVLIHGRRDISGPTVTAWRLHRQWPGSVLHVVESEGHGGPESSTLMTQAVDELTRS